MKIVCVFLILFSKISAQEASASEALTILPPEPPRRLCIIPCTNEYEPVCGLDGKTYTNNCHLICYSNTELAHKGCCNQDNCPYPPPGPMSEPPIRLCFAPCTNECKPVCGKDGITYRNSCYLTCNSNTDFDYEGPCKQKECGVKPPFPLIPSKIRFCKKPCTNECKPVCGKNGKNYRNFCYLNCNSNTQLAYHGFCKKKCQDIYQPVCGEDGKTYPNACEAEVNGVKIVSQGPCKCICPLFVNEVCGVDGVTYRNACHANCAGVKIKFNHACVDCSQKCITNYIPVCGSDGLTYRNLCELFCIYKLQLKQDGACPSNLPVCLCPDTKDPRCGANGQIYFNFCMISCDNMSEKPLSFCQA